MPSRIWTTFTGAAVLLSTLVPGAPQATAQGGVKAGLLTCNVSSGFGLVLGSSRAMTCTFSGSGAEAEYTGKITKFGVDLGYLHEAVIVWAVFAPAVDIGPEALAGGYAGATGSATLGIGLGAHVLVGGSRDAISLQPVSIEGSQGINVAGGVAAMSLNTKGRTT